MGGPGVRAHPDIPLASPRSWMSQSQSPQVSRKDMSVLCIPLDLGAGV